MGFRFFKRVKIAPGLSLNFSKGGISPSIGVPGARLTFGRRGPTGTVGIPGSGLYYTDRLGGKSSRRGRARKASGATRDAAPQRVEQRPEERLRLGFFDRLLMPKREEHFVDGCRAYLEGDASKARAHFEQAHDQPDAAFLAGYLALKDDDLERAEHWLRRALDGGARLGEKLDELGVRIEVLLPISEDFRAVVAPCPRGARLGLAEVHQLRGDDAAALEVLEVLHLDDAEDVVVRVSIAELLLERVEAGHDPDPSATRRRVLELSSGVENESNAHAALMLFRARALRGLELFQAARDVLTTALRRRKDRDQHLLTALRYERALVYEALGQRSRARGEFERVYAEEPDHEDAAERLGLG